jgi:P27 family predicted phage terminase small subunit
MSPIHDEYGLKLVEVAPIQSPALAKGFRSMSGPPKKPTSLKLLQGTFRRDRAPSNEPKPEIAIPDVPPHLSAEAQAEWVRVSHDLVKLGLLSKIDRAALSAYCEAWSDFVDATRLCSTQDGKDRKVLITKEGNVIENPYFSIKKRTMEIMHKFLIEFGMTPASRTRIEASPLPSAGKGNPFSNIG